MESTWQGPRIAVVGSGPSGCFIAGALRKSLPDAAITVLDRLPSPFGLLRYGVASDHQGTKAISRQFERLFVREGIEFLGNVAISADGSNEANSIGLEELQRRSDIVVLATGLPADRSLGIPGEHLPGVLGAGVLTRLLNSHPDEVDTLADTRRVGAKTAVIGFGNVAIDLIRFLAKTTTDYEGSDINEKALEAYHFAPATRVDVLSRSPLGRAKVDAQMVRELGDIDGIKISLHGDLSGADSADRTQMTRVEALRRVAEQSSDRDDPRIDLHVHFGILPRRINGGPGWDGEGERVIALDAQYVDGETREFPVDTVLTAVGFEAGQHSLVEETGADTGRMAPGLYRVGWCRRGPQGTIPENRRDAIAVAAEIVEDLESGLVKVAAHEEPLLPEHIRRQAVTFDEWLEVDRHERELAPDGRPRKKLSSAEEMLRVAHGKQ